MPALPENYGIEELGAFQMGMSYEAVINQMKDKINEIVVEVYDLRNDVDVLIKLMAKILNKEINSNE